MLWLAAQVFFLCLISFLAGAGITVLALRRKPEPKIAESVAVEEVREAEEIVEPGQQIEPMIIKASKKSMRYHTPDSPYYNRVSASLTFISPEDAELAGYKPWNADKVKAPSA
ncbi:hypothetical protein LWC34_30960 [Kibdelosporangium philippinense]|uniref:Uncharacterized protein n=1 Tax=Kibdelosporangium philippinense TaxID=211113 RepID=A0ABS8ZHA6_9PSEU|nr:hypothetical protein [Kibdelosporangium philippinense]MCE7007208.1 hypothetical protein [Kibdelosporangium philippinense]